MPEKSLSSRESQQLSENEVIELRKRGGELTAEIVKIDSEAKRKKEPLEIELGQIGEKLHADTRKRVLGSGKDVISVWTDLIVEHRKAQTPESARAVAQRIEEFKSILSPQEEQEIQDFMQEVDDARFWYAGQRWRNL